MTCQHEPRQQPKLNTLLELRERPDQLVLAGSNQTACACPVLSTSILVRRGATGVGPELASPSGRFSACRQRSTRSYAMRSPVLASSATAHPCSLWLFASSNPGLPSCHKNHSSDETTSENVGGTFIFSDSSPYFHIEMIGSCRQTGPAEMQHHVCMLACS
jgi:hypothetical protein